MRKGLIVAAAASLLLGACSSSSSSIAPTPVNSSGGGGGSGAALSLTAKDFAFSPTALTANAGAVTLTVTNAGSALHSFTLDDGSVSVDIPAGSSQVVPLDLTGSVSFHCQYHPTQMMGTITVGGAAVTTPASGAASASTTPRY